ncbi:hypothetical protein ES319_D11G087100v1 [Gossypium barbadense]|uniref:Flavin-containing monooxygenase n=3 Tax=Gossypium TaxID=3633 RepID=A0A5J5P8H3_GOSBA|nr:hypothetical protein ES319_D11G087100v1 [Gossypium barbadense]TYG44352.1 hypothetical protein ES288_D11G091100v1 [Gossypium darwinii]TYH42853.1 hypothetical protein ES332_D11G090000v1 [Gossypium tomentosum]
MGQSYNVAVIGAGTAGLVTARELQREGHRVTVFEKANQVGGTWLYDSLVESDLLGLDPNREIVHSSLYKSLRTNLPRQVMSFLDYPFVKRESGDTRPFPGHEEVLRFLQDFARDFGLMELIRFGHEVIRVELVDVVSHDWVVESRTRETESRWESKEEVFEAVVICNGKNTEPKVAEFPGRDTWPGLQMHSHNYRTPEQFENKIVVLIGNGPSATDILREISPLAKQVHLAFRGSDIKLINLKNYDNAWPHSPIECAHEDGKVVFQDGSIVEADVIIHCTGYKFHLPFLKSNGIVTVDDNRVGPLYKHIFPPSLAPWLSFVGLNYRALVFRVIELQAIWVAKVLSGKVKLPTQEAMAASVEEFYEQMEKAGWPKYHTHSLQNDEGEYASWLAAQSDIRPPKSWEEITFFSFVKGIFGHGENFRDTWDVDKWIQEIESSD